MLLQLEPCQIWAISYLLCVIIPHFKGTKRNDRS
nr:MAG TPA: hypothetical protein [Caudoviricetes sp.]